MLAGVPRKSFQELARLPNGRIAPHSNAKYSPSTEAFQVITPKNSYPDGWKSAGTFIDFEINNFSIDIIDEWQIRFGVNWKLLDTNWNGDDFELYTNPSVFLLDHVELWVDNVLSESIYNYSLWQDIKRYTTSSEAEGVGQWLNYTSYNPNLGTPIAGVQELGYSPYFPNIGVGSEALVTNETTPFYYIIPIRTVLEKCSINWRILSKTNNSFLRVYYNNNYNNTWAYGTYTNNDDDEVPITNAMPVSFKVEMYGVGTRLSVEEARKQDELYRTSGVSAISTCIKSFPIPTMQTIATGNYSGDIVMTGLEGTITQLTAYVATEAEAIASAVIYSDNDTTIDLVHSNLGTQTIYPTNMTLIDQTGCAVFLPNMPTEIMMYNTIRGYYNCPFQYLLMLYNFSSDPRATIEKGEVSGGMFFKNWRLKFMNAVELAASSSVVNPIVFVTLYQLAQVNINPATGKCSVDRV